MLNMENKITPAIKSIMDNNDYQDPIFRQFIASDEEMNIVSEEISDPIGDDRFSKVKGVIHRYPDRALLIPKGDCLVLCRFCFRKWKLAQEETELSMDEVDSAIKYLRDNQSIWEVILTGGEPLATTKNKLSYILQELDKIDHIGIVRIHSRVPIVAPEMIDDDFIKILKINKPVYLVIHCNNVKEITKHVEFACRLLSNAGIPLLSQTALLKSINDSPEALEKLFRRLLEIKVKPYYLHHCDLVQGTSHFRTTIAEGQEILKSIRGNVSGLCWPTYVLDIPNGYGKVPLSPNYIEVSGKGQYIVTDYKGKKHPYPPIGENGSQ